MDKELSCLTAQWDCSDVFLRQWDESQLPVTAHTWTQPELAFSFPHVTSPLPPGAS